MNPWDNIFKGKFNDALHQADELYKLKNDSFNLRAMAICHLLLNNYEAALVSFNQLFETNSKEKRLGDVLCLHIGLCHYALNNIELAKKYFAFPITNRSEVQYTGGIFRPSSFLFFVSKKFEDAKLRTKSIRELKKSQHTIPMYLTGRIGENELELKLDKIENETLRNRSECVFEFYKAVRAFEVNDDERYKFHIEQCEKLNGKYLEFEFYFAKIESQKLNREST